MRNTRHYVVLICIILLGFSLRLYQLDAVAFRGDEAFSVQRWAAVPLNISLTEIASIEPHPPLTYVLFRIWGQTVGVESEFGMRMLGVLTNLLGVSALYAIGKRLSGRATVGFLAAFLWAVHPFEIFHAQDFRNYAIWAGLSAVSLYLALSVIDLRRCWGLYALFSLITALIFYNELITIGVMTLYGWLIAWRDWRFIRNWTALNTAIITITIGAFLYFQGDLLNGGGYGGTTGGFEIAQWWQRFIPVLVIGDTLSLDLLRQFDPLTSLWSLIVLLVVTSLILTLRQNRRAALFSSMMILLPLIVLSLISLRLNIFRPRYIMSAIPGYLIALSVAGIGLFQSRQIMMRALSSLILLTWLGLSLISLNQHYHDPAFRKSPDWPALITYLEINTSAEEFVIQTGVDPAFGLYYERADITAREGALPIDVTQTVPDLLEDLNDIHAEFDSIWIVGRTFPDWANAGVVENWAIDNLQRVRQTEIAGLPVQQFMSWDVLASEIEEQPLAIYNDAIELVGINVFPVEPTNELVVWVYWHPLQQTDTSLTVFMHLIGDVNPATGSPLWAQDDHPPQNGRATTDLWQTEEVYRDVFVLPLDAVADGEYRLHIGFYDPVTNERAILETGEDAYITEPILIELNNP